MIHFLSKKKRCSSFQVGLAFSDVEPPLFLCLKRMPYSTFRQVAHQRLVQNKWYPGGQPVTAIEGEDEVPCRVGWMRRWVRSSDVFFLGGESINKFAFPYGDFFGWLGFCWGYVGWFCFWVGDTLFLGWKLVPGDQSVSGKVSSSTPLKISGVFLLVLGSVTLYSILLNFKPLSFCWFKKKHPQKFSPLKKHNAWKMSFLLKRSLFRGKLAVKLRGCKLFGNLHPHKSISPSLGGLNIARSYLSLGYIEDSTTQLCGDCNKPLQGSLFNIQDVMESIRPGFFSWLIWRRGSGFPQRLRFQY